MNEKMSSALPKLAAIIHAETMYIETEETPTL